jgi:ketol-acid reductoisomerase
MSDADPAAIAEETVAVVGYGNLGRSVAHNLRDEGITVIVGNIEDAYAALARDEGFTVAPIDVATARADIVFVLIPDEEIPACFASAIGPHLRPGAAVAFGSGYCLAFDLIAPPASADVLLIAPRMLGDEVRRAKLQGEGCFSYISVEHDASGRARARLLAIARAIGALTRGALELSAAQEASLDLFIEQSVGPYIGAAIQSAFAVGVEAGLPAEALVLEMYRSGEMARVFEASARDGFIRSSGHHGATALYGGFVRTATIDHEDMQARFRAILDDIASGRFAAQFQAERDSGGSTLEVIATMCSGATDPQSQAEDRIRQALGQPAETNGAAARRA